MQLLPFKIIDWVDPEKSNPDNNSDDGSIRCVLEVNLNYPDELADLHNDYLLAAKKIKLTKNMLSEYQL